MAKYTIIKPSEFFGEKKDRKIKEHAQNFGSLTDDQALSLINRSPALDEAVEQLRMKYVPLINKVLGQGDGHVFQMDRRITALIDLQQASQIPLAQEQR
jgi:hypothetical protein